LSFKVNNVISLHEHDLDMFVNGFVTSFFTFSFSNTDLIFPFIYSAYINDDTSRIISDKGQDEECMVVDCEEILSYGISFFTGLLTNTAIWQPDILLHDNSLGEKEMQASEKAQQVLDQNMFSEANIHRILQVLTVHYLILTKEEVEAWQADPLKFYMDAKNESNECKGNYLRGKAMNLIANFRINHDTAFSSFVNYIVTTELPKIGTGQLALPK
jgi:hypothetical protein